MGMSKTQILRILKPLHGGMVNKVFLAEMDGKHVVLKMGGDRAGFEREYKALELLKEKDFPVPAPFFVDELNDKPVLVIEYIPGVNLGVAPLSSFEEKRIQEEMARAVAHLHSNTGPGFGDPFGQLEDAWWKVMQKMYWQEIEGLRGNRRLDEGYVRKLEKIAFSMKNLLERPVSPVLVHGDIWATNVMVKRERDGYHLAAFLDPGCIYADPEYELAYIEIFRTGGRPFFEEYSKYHRIDPNYVKRRPVYWLLTMLIHVNFFGDWYYVARAKELTERVLKELQ